MYQILLVVLILTGATMAKANQAEKANSFDNKRTTNPVLEIDKYKNCGNNTLAQELAKLVIEDPKQNRSQLKCSPLLAKIAEQKAREMASLERVNHYGKTGANRRLIDAGYKLAIIYPRMFENNVEAVAGGLDNPKALWKKFKKSDIHRNHLLAEHEFYLLQNEIGAAYYKDTKTAHVEFWVIYIAHRNNNIEFNGQVAESKD